MMAAAESRGQNRHISIASASRAFV